MPVPITQFLAHLDIDSKNLGFISHISENHPQIHSYLSGFYIMNVKAIFSLQFFCLFTMDEFIDRYFCCQQCLIYRSVPLRTSI